MHFLRPFSFAERGMYSRLPQWILFLADEWIMIAEAEDPSISSPAPPSIRHTKTLTVPLIGSINLLPQEFFLVIRPKAGEFKCPVTNGSILIMEKVGLLR
jgi:hypothetical protein